MSSMPVMPHASELHTAVSLYSHHRFPAEIISHYVWLYFCFALTFRVVEEISLPDGAGMLELAFQGLEIERGLDSTGEIAELPKTVMRNPWKTDEAAIR
jgi:putative transposase